MELQGVFSNLLKFFYFPFFLEFSDNSSGYSQHLHALVFIILLDFSAPGTLESASLALYNDDARVKRSKSRSCLHDKAFDLGTRQT